MTPEMMQTIMKILVIEFFLIAIGYGIIRDWPRCLYFISAGVLNVSVMLIK